MVGEVGGDFHDIIDLNDGRAAIVIGDVAGFGPAAAEHADELQAEVHRLFRRTVEPPEVLSLLDTHVERAGSYVTMACAVVDPAARTLSMASAGHPPVLRTDGVESTLLDGIVGPPLGVPAPRRMAEYPLVGDTALFLYTDGLVERRERSLEETLDELVDAGRGLHGATASAAELARRLTARLGQPADDATVVSVRVLGAGVHRLGDTVVLGSRPRIVLRVYVDTHDLRSARTEAVVHELALRARDAFDFVMEVVDVSQPGVDTEQDGILATPTIVRLRPEPVLRVVGTVRSAAELAQVLQLPPAQEDTL